MRRSMMVGSVACAALALLGHACSEDGDNAPPTPLADASIDRVVPGDPDADLPPLVDDDAGEAGTLPFDAGTDFASSEVVINEISGGDEWVELYNHGAAAEDLSGYRLADRDKSTGEPKLGEAVTFPVGTVLGSAQYLLVRGGGIGDAGKSCPSPNESDAGDAGPCFNAAFGISNKEGESLFLVAPDGGVVGKVVYPPKASSGGTSYSRIPNGVPTAAFKTVPKTPYAANVE